MTVSVIVPAYNSSKFIGQCLQSVILQSIDDWECIVVDDGSTDDTAEVVKEYTSRDSRFRLVHQENSGQSAAKNYGLSMASGRYIWFLDSDDWLETNALEVASAYLDANPMVASVLVGIDEVDESGCNRRRGFRDRWVPGRFGARRLSESERSTPFVTFFCVTGQGPFALHRRTTLEEIGGYDSNLWSHEDADLFCRLALIGQVHAIPDPLYVYRIKEWGMTQEGQKRGGGKAFAEKWYSVDSHWVANNPEVRSALRYYWRVHAPLRSLKVAAKSLRLAISRRKIESARWAVQCIVDAICSFVRSFSKEVNTK